VPLDVARDGLKRVAVPSLSVSLFSRRFGSWLGPCFVLIFRYPAKGVVPLFLFFFDDPPELAACPHRQKWSSLPQKFNIFQPHGP